MGGPVVTLLAAVVVAACDLEHDVVGNASGDPSRLPRFGDVQITVRERRTGVAEDRAADVARVVSLNQLPRDDEARVRRQIALSRSHRQRDREMFCWDTRRKASNMATANVVESQMRPQRVRADINKLLLRLLTRMPRHNMLYL